MLDCNGTAHVSLYWMIQHAIVNYNPSWELKMWKIIPVNSVCKQVKQPFTDRKKMKKRVTLYFTLISDAGLSKALNI